MKQVLTRIAVIFTMCTLVCIVLFGFFYEWDEQNVEVWSAMIAIGSFLIIIHHRFIQKR